MSKSNMAAGALPVNTRPFAFRRFEVVPRNHETPQAAANGESSAKPKGQGKRDDGPSIPKLWADRLINQKQYPWFAESTHTSGGEAVYRWNGSFLQMVGAEEGISLAAQWLDQTCPNKATDGVAKSAWAYGTKRLRQEKPMPEHDRSRNIIPCADVYLEMNNKGELTSLAPDPMLGMTYALNVSAGTPVGERHALKPLPQDSLFRQFLERALPDAEARALVQEQCGLCLLPANYQMATWWTGEAGSGKSTLAELCKAMQRQVANISLDQLGDRFGLEALVGVSLVVVDEVEHEKWPEGKFKSLVSCNGVFVDRKNEKGLMSYAPRAKWIITSNDKPFVRDRSNGVWRRLCIVPFNVVIPERERIPDFHSVLLEREAGLVLDWMLEGAARIVRRGGFMPEHERPEAVRELKEEARNDSDSVRAWVRQFDVRCDASEAKTKDAVYDHYVRWCEAAHRSPLDRNPFWKGLRGQLGEIKNLNRVVQGRYTYHVAINWTTPTPALVKPASSTASTTANNMDDVSFWDDAAPSTCA